MKPNVRVPQPGSKIRWWQSTYLVISSSPRVVKLIESGSADNHHHIGTEYNLDNANYASWEFLIRAMAIEILEDPFVTFVREVLDAQKEDI